MDSKYISLEKTNYFTSLMLDYIDEKEDLKSFYHRFPTESAYLEQAKEKLNSFSNREILVQQFKAQLADLDLSKKQKKNLDLLAEKNTVTITTGHQLNLFTGPIFFFYKILQIIKQCKELNRSQDEINFVPVFWMATEDHDFEEINHFRCKDRIIHWDKPHGGPVGQLTTAGLDEVFKSFLSLIPNGKKKDELTKLIELTYLSSETLTEATRKLVHLLFKDYGLLMLDGDDKILKSVFAPTIEKEILSQNSFNQVNLQKDKLEELNYSIQVNPREINLFYIAHPLSRERIIKDGEIYKVLNTSISFTEKEIVAEIQNSPEKFSPNVILRPLYQETILPNVAYIGGGGELAYWLELKKMFDSNSIPFPLLVLRNSMLIRTTKQLKKQLALNLKDEDLFLSSRTIVKSEIVENSELVAALPQLKNELTHLFEKLENLATATDSSFADMVQAQKKKQLNGFEKIENRLVKAELKTKESIQNRIEDLLKDLNQEKGLQERVKNFSDFEFLSIDSFIDSIYQNIQPFAFNFIINTLDEDI